MLIRDFLTEEAQILLLSCRASTMLSLMAPSGRPELTRHGRLSFGFSAADGSRSLIAGSAGWLLLPQGVRCCQVWLYRSQPERATAAKYSSLTASFHKVALTERDS